MNPLIGAPGHRRSHCPINFGLEIFGDKWTLLILRDLLMQGKCSFREFQASEEGISTSVLADRLMRLEQSGLVRPERATEDGRQVRYQPTPACKRLLPVLVEMAYWGATHDAETASPPAFARAYEHDRAALLATLAAGADPTALK
jgi:DNA-binding HxlR family transcriptional regulator